MPYIILGTGDHRYIPYLRYIGLSLLFWQKGLRSLNEAMAGCARVQGPSSPRSNMTVPGKKAGPLGTRGVYGDFEEERLSRDDFEKLPHELLSKDPLKGFYRGLYRGSL